MEFDHVGLHCSDPLCKQKDFLPFTCDSCHKPFCLAHRSYEAHHCDGALKKDMTSIDCPICNKSVKFDKSKDPNQIWEDHYNYGCSRVNSKPTTSANKCARRDCTVNLGPSNTFQCPKCFKKVCLSHRMSEEHECVSGSSKPSSSGNPRDTFLSRFDNKSSKPVSSKVNNNSASSKQKPVPAKPTTTSSGSNRNSNPPPAPIPARASSKETYSCPICGKQESSVDILSAHVEQHLMNNETVSSSAPNPPAPSSGIEVSKLSCNFPIFIKLFY